MLPSWDSHHTLSPAQDASRAGWVGCQAERPGDTPTQQHTARMSPGKPGSGQQPWHRPQGTRGPRSQEDSTPMWWPLRTRLGPHGPFRTRASSQLHLAGEQGTGSGEEAEGVPVEGTGGLGLRGFKKRQVPGLCLPTPTPTPLQSRKSYSLTPCTAPPPPGPLLPASSASLASSASRPSPG